MISVVDSGLSPTVVNSPCNSTVGSIAFTLDMLLQSSLNGTSFLLKYLPASSLHLCDNFICLFTYHQITTISNMTNNNPTMVSQTIIAHLFSSQLGLFPLTRSNLDFNSSKLILSRGSNKSSIFSKEKGTPLLWVPIYSHWLTLILKKSLLLQIFLQPGNGGKYQ